MWAEPEFGLRRGGVVRQTVACDISAEWRSLAVLAKVAQFLKLMVTDLSLFFPVMKTMT